MKLSVLLILFTSLCSGVFGQNFSGQWKGEFIDKSSASGSWGGDRCEYVLDLECKGKQVTGYSYTYFTDEGKRYYTICRLTGTLDKSKKYVEVTEVERTKTNVPARIRNCFQQHRLTYSKEGDTENFNGNWSPAPSQDGNCGFGVTMLSRRSLRASYPNFNNSGTQTAKRITPKKTPPAKQATAKAPVKTVPANAKTTPKTQTQAPVAKLVPKQPEITLTPNKGSVPIENTPPVQINTPTITTPLAFERRNTSLLKTLEVENTSIKVELYDNGEIDGDSISVYYNKNLILSKKRLTDKPISLTIPVEENGGVNELVMFAENLGSIPPNTALMIVMDGTKRYEVRITSDLQKSGTIRFVHKAK